MHLEQTIVAPETQVAAGSIGWAVMAQAPDAENPATVVGHPTAVQAAAPDWFGAGYRLRLSADQRRGTARSE